MTTTRHPISSQMAGHTEELLAKNGGATFHKIDGLLVPFFIQKETLDQLKVCT